ncbi:MAG TPA: NAD-dependent epimerase/dehydratase family protein [Planctomycetota bacterium]|jgi:CDP-paratose 2-epimerase
MKLARILITGGAGFVGSNLALRFRRHVPTCEVLALDNLKRRGSELNIRRLTAEGIQFQHGDVRCPEDLAELPKLDLLIDCSAEPSVQAGTRGSPLPVITNNLTGTVNCLEAARRTGAAFLFLSTSRVYPIKSLNEAPFRETATRFEWSDTGVGLSSAGVTEAFPLEGARSIYGATKLSGELLIQEYVANCGMRALINRCGVLAGPWQMGKVDQGVITLWVAHHFFGKPLSYIGFGGAGKQVRDILHVDDLFELLLRQLDRPDAWDGRVYNIGGGRQVSVSLLELTELCRKATGRQIDIKSVPETSAVDVRIYLSDCGKARRDFGWQPNHSPEQLVSDIFQWLRQNETALRPVFAG